MSPSSVDPVNNFETNVGVGHQSRRAGGPPRPEMAKRVLDVEALLSWAYKHELPKDRGLGGSGGEPCAVSPMFAMGAFGTRVDYYHREPGFPSAMGPPHPDALLVEAEVERLAEHAEQEIDMAEIDFGGIASLLPAHGAANAVRRALRMMPAIVARCAKLEQRPFWFSSTQPYPLRTASGTPAVLRWEPQYAKTVTGEEVEHEVLVPVEAKAKGEYPFGAYSPLRYDPDPQAMAEERAEYAVWWAAMVAIAAALTGRLTSHIVLAPGAAQRPWIEDVDLGEPPRIFADLRGSYRSEAAATAAAHRALGTRRLPSARSATKRIGAPTRRVALAAPTRRERACAAG